VQSGIPDCRDLDVLMARLVNGVEAEEREEQVGGDAFGASTVCHDQTGVDPVQRPFGDDDRYLVDLRGHELRGLGVGLQQCGGH
jgi:hypothetical protein